MTQLNTIYHNLDLRIGWLNVHPKDETIAKCLRIIQSNRWNSTDFPLRIKKVTYFCQNNDLSKDNSFIGRVITGSVVGGGVGLKIGSNCTQNSSPRVRKVVIPTTTLVGGVIGGGVGAYRYTKTKPYHNLTQAILNDAINAYVSLQFEDDPLLSINGRYTCPLSGGIIQQCARLPQSQTCYDYNQLLGLEDEEEGTIEDPNQNGFFHREDIILDGWKDVIIAQRILYLIDKELQDLGENPSSEEKVPREVMRNYFHEKYKALWDREDDKLGEKYKRREFVPGGDTKVNSTVFKRVTDEFIDTCGDREQFFSEERWNSLIEQENQ